jgi:hypothetical protein
MNVGCFSMLVSLAVFVGVSWMSPVPADERIAPDVRAAMEV